MGSDNSPYSNIEVARGLAFSANDAFEALQLLVEKDHSALTVGVLAGHVIENSLKAHLALIGFNELKLKALGHDLIKCWDATNLTELKLDPVHPTWLIGINYSHKKIRYRYPVGYENPWLPHPEEYMSELAYILAPLKENLLYENGKFVVKF